MKKYSLAINGNPYTVKILEVTADSVKAEVNGAKHTVAIEDIENINMFPTETVERKAVPDTAPTTAKSANVKNAKVSSRGDFCSFGSGNLEAPIPGQIISIDVKQGDDIEKGDRLLILEAMKMENALTSTRNGVIKEVLVAEGEAVTQDQPLIIFE